MSFSALRAPIGRVPHVAQILKQISTPIYNSESNANTQLIKPLATVSRSLSNVKASALYIYILVASFS